MEWMMVPLAATQTFGWIIVAMWKPSANCTQSSSLSSEGICQPVTERIVPEHITWDPMISQPDPKFFPCSPMEYNLMPSNPPLGCVIPVEHMILCSNQCLFHFFFSPIILWSTSLLQGSFPNVFLNFRCSRSFQKIEVETEGRYWETGPSFQASSSTGNVVNYVSTKKSF